MRGKNSSTIIVFTPDVGAERFYVKAEGKFLIFSRDQDLGEQGSKACNYLVKGQCPLVKGKQVNYKLTMPVEADEYKINGVTVSYKIVKGDDGGDELLACFRVKVNIVDA